MSLLEVVVPEAFPETCRKGSFGVPEAFPVDFRKNNSLFISSSISIRHLFLSFSAVISPFVISCLTRLLDKLSNSVVSSTEIYLVSMFRRTSGNLPPLPKFPLAVNNSKKTVFKLKLKYSCDRMNN